MKENKLWRDLYRDAILSTLNDGSSLEDVAKDAASFTDLAVKEFKKRFKLDDDSPKAKDSVLDKKLDAENAKIFSNLKENPDCEEERELTKKGIGISASVKAKKAPPKTKPKVLTSEPRDLAVGESATYFPGTYAQWVEEYYRIQRIQGAAKSGSNRILTATKTYFFSIKYTNTKSQQFVTVTHEKLPVKIPATRPKISPHTYKVDIAGVEYHRLEKKGYTSVGRNKLKDDNGNIFDTGEYYGTSIKVN